MKKTIVILFACLMLLSGYCIAGGPIDEEIPEMPPNPDFMVNYNEVMIEFTVADKLLTYAWQAPPAGADNLAGPEEYFWQSVDVDLTDEQLKKVKDWVSEYKVYELEDPELTGDEESFEAAWYHDLEIYDGEDEFILYWTDAAQWEDPEMQVKVDDAIDALKDMVRQFAREKM